jgi:hypothetical protein
VSAANRMHLIAHYDSVHWPSPSSPSQQSFPRQRTRLLAHAFGRPLTDVYRTAHLEALAHPHTYTHSCNPSARTRAHPLNHNPPPPPSLSGLTQSPSTSPRPRLVGLASAARARSKNDVHPRHRSVPHTTPRRCRGQGSSGRVRR